MWYDIAIGTIPLIHSCLCLLNMVNVIEWKNDGSSPWVCLSFTTSYTFKYKWKKNFGGSYYQIFHCGVREGNLENISIVVKFFLLVDGASQYDFLGWYLLQSCSLHELCEKCCTFLFFVHNLVWTSFCFRSMQNIQISSIRWHERHYCLLIKRHTLMGGSKNGCNGTRKIAIEHFFMEQKVYDKSQGGTTQENNWDFLSNATRKAQFLISSLFF